MIPATLGRIHMTEQENSAKALTTTTDVFYVSGYGPLVKLQFKAGDAEIMIELDPEGLREIATQLSGAADNAEAFARECESKLS